MSKNKMTNQKFIRKLKRAKNNIKHDSGASHFYLVSACHEEKIFWAGGLENATFADNTMLSIAYLKSFPANQRRAAALTVIDASIKALQLNIKNNA